MSVRDLRVEHVLPLAVDDGPRVRQGVVLLVFGLGFVALSALFPMLATWGTLTAGRGVPVGMAVPLGLFALVGLGMSVWGLTHFAHRIRITVDGSFVDGERRGLRGARRWREPLSAYRGVLAEVERRRRNKGADLVIYHVKLKHGRDAGLDVPLYRSTSSHSAQRGESEAFAKLLDLPVLVDAGDGGYTERAVDDLDKSIADLAAEGKIDVPRPPTGRLSAPTLRSFDHPNGFGYEQRFAAIGYLAAGASAVAAGVAFVFGGAPLIAVVALVVGVAAGVVGAAIRLRYTVDRERVRMDVRLGSRTIHTHELPADSIEEVEIVPNMGVAVVSDHGRMMFGLAGGAQATEHMHAAVLSTLAGGARHANAAPTAGMSARSPEALSAPVESLRSLAVRSLDAGRTPAQVAAKLASLGAPAGDVDAALGAIAGDPRSAHASAMRAQLDGGETDSGRTRRVSVLEASAGTTTATASVVERSRPGASGVRLLAIAIVAGIGLAAAIHVLDPPWYRALRGEPGTGPVSAAPAPASAPASAPVSAPVSAPARAAAPAVAAAGAAIHPAIANFIAPKPLLAALVGLRTGFGECARMASEIAPRAGLRAAGEGPVVGDAGADRYVLFDLEAHDRVSVAVFCRTYLGSPRAVDWAFVDRFALASDPGGALARIRARDSADGRSALARDPLVRFGSLARFRLASPRAAANGPHEQALVDALEALMANPVHFERLERANCCARLLDEEARIHAAMSAINATVRAPAGVEVSAIPRTDESAPTIDGVMNPGEWNTGLALALGSGDDAYEVRLLADGYWLYAAVSLPGHRDPWKSPRLQFQHQPATALVKTQHAFLGGGMRKTYDRKVPEHPRYYSGYRSYRVTSLGWQGEAPYKMVRGREAKWSPRMRLDSNPFGQQGFLTDANVAVGYDEFWTYEIAFPFGEFGLAPGIPFQARLRLERERIGDPRWYVISPGVSPGPDAAVTSHARWKDSTDMPFPQALDVLNAQAFARDGALDFVAFVSSNPDTVLMTHAEAGVPVGIVPFEVYVDADDDPATGTAPPGMAEAGGFEYRVVLEFGDYRVALGDADPSDLAARWAAVRATRSATLHDLATGERTALVPRFSDEHGRTHDGISQHHAISVPYDRIGAAPGVVVRLAFYEADHAYEHAALAFSLDRRIRLE